MSRISVASASRVHCSPNTEDSALDVGDRASGARRRHGGGMENCSAARRTGVACFDSGTAASVEERAFLDGPVNELCAMLDDWEITHELADLPPEVWGLLKRKGFFAMICSEEVRRSSSRLGRSGARKDLRPLHHRGVCRHGPELARSGRAAAQVRHGSAEGLLPATSRAR